MPTRSTRSSDVPRDHLRRVADLVLAAADDDPTLLPVAIGVPDPGADPGTDTDTRTDRDGLELAIRPLLGDHPLDDVLGFVAPGDWCAYGLAVSGTARPLPGETTDAPAAGSAGPDDPSRRRLVEAPTPMRMVHLQPRRGRSLSLLDLPGLDGVQEVGESGPAGRVADACLRVMGRRTPAPRGGAGALAEVVWVSRLLHRVITSGGTTLDEATLRDLHPLLGGGHDAADGARELTELARLGDVLGWPTRWRTWRLGLSSHDEPVLGIAPDVADWMDDGMFERWIHGELPSLDGLVDDFGSLVPRRVLEDVLRVVRSLPSPGRQRSAVP